MADLPAPRPIYLTEDERAELETCCARYLAKLDKYPDDLGETRRFWRGMLSKFQGAKQ